MDLVRFRNCEFKEKTFAFALSLVIHLAPLIWLMGGVKSSLEGNLESGGHSKGAIALEFVKEDEFRQKVEFVLSSPETSGSTASGFDSAELVTESSDVSGEFSEAVDPKALDDASNARAAEGHLVAASRSDGETVPAEGPSKSESGGRTAAGDDALRSAYLSALRQAIREEWGWIEYQGDCSLTLRQVAGGMVQSAVSSDCDLDAAARRSLEAAALMAQPLPYVGYERVFSESLNLRFSE